MPYNFAADSFHMNKLCSRLFKRSAILQDKRPFCVFEPPLGDIGATYDNHLRLIGKREGDFLLVLIKLFSLGVTAERLLVQNRRFRSNGGRFTQNLGRRGRPHQPFFFSEN